MPSAPAPAPVAAAPAGNAGLHLGGAWGQAWRQVELDVSAQDDAAKVRAIKSYGLAQLGRDDLNRLLSLARSG